VLWELLQVEFHLACMNQVVVITVRWVNIGLGLGNRQLRFRDSGVVATELRSSA